MAKKWLNVVNLIIAGLLATILIATLIFFSMRPSELSPSRTPLSKRTLPQGSFIVKKEAFDAIGTSILDLKFSPVPLQLPDLKPHLIYCGKNGRPDAQSDPLLHFTFVGTNQLCSIANDHPLYLVYDKKSPSRYVFSPNNAPTSLWIEASPNGNETIIKVTMKNETGVLIREPASHAQFNLGEKENVRIAGRTWDLGKWRVDGSLLARQKARWMGPDSFLEKHGGEEHRALQGKHRIDFTDEEESYSIFVGLNDCLIWENNRWKVVQPGKESLKSPLLMVKRVDERLMNFELWDIDGKGKVSLNLVKTNEPWTSGHLHEQFRCVGARTRSRYIFEIGDQRLLLSPDDWLLQTKEGWIKLASPQEIDDYVNRKLSGVLFVFDGAERKEDRQVLLGSMFNASRTAMQQVELPIQQAGIRSFTTGMGRRERIEDFEEEESEEYSDDDEENEEDKKPPARPSLMQSKSAEKKGKKLLDKIKAHLIQKD